MNGVIAMEMEIIRDNANKGNIRLKWSEVDEWEGYFREKEITELTEVLDSLENKYLEKYQSGVLEQILAIDRILKERGEKC
jgi:hypothetical protein